MIAVPGPWFVSLLAELGSSFDYVFPAIVVATPPPPVGVYPCFLTTGLLGIHQCLLAAAAAAGRCLFLLTMPTPLQPLVLMLLLLPPPPLLLLLLLQMRLVDVTNPRRLKTLDTYRLPAGAGAHVVKFNKDTWTAAVATYLLDIAGRLPFRG